MSQENVDQQYRAADAFTRHDLEAFLEVCDPDIVLVSRHLELEGSGHLRGHAAVRRWWESLLSVYPDFTSEVEEVRDLGGVTVARHYFRGQGIESGAQLEQHHWQVTTVARRQGRLVAELSNRSRGPGGGPGVRRPRRRRQGPFQLAEAASCQSSV